MFDISCQSSDNPRMVPARETSDPRTGGGLAGHDKCTKQPLMRGNWSYSRDLCVIDIDSFINVCAPDCTWHGGGKRDYNFPRLMRALHGRVIVNPGTARCCVRHGYILRIELSSWSVFILRILPVMPLMPVMLSKASFSVCRASWNMPFCFKYMRAYGISDK